VVHCAVSVLEPLPWYAHRTKRKTYLELVAHLPIGFPAQALRRFAVSITARSLPKRRQLTVVSGWCDSYQPILSGDRELVQIVDAALADSARRSGAWLVCHVGCTQCCIGVFAISQSDAVRLQEGGATIHGRCGAIMLIKKPDISFIRDHQQVCLSRGPQVSGGCSHAGRRHRRRRGLSAARRSGREAAWGR
jgi:hypothetical protein